MRPKLLVAGLGITHYSHSHSLAKFLICHLRPSVPYQSDFRMKQTAANKPEDGRNYHPLNQIP
jgi:hypothetical protein